MNFASDLDVGSLETYNTGLYAADGEPIESIVYKSFDDFVRNGQNKGKENDHLKEVWGGLDVSINRKTGNITEGEISKKIGNLAFYDKEFIFDQEDPEKLIETLKTNIDGAFDILNNRYKFLLNKGVLRVEKSNSDDYTNDLIESFKLKDGKLLQNTAKGAVEDDDFRGRIKSHPVSSSLDIEKDDLLSLSIFMFNNFRAISNLKIELMGFQDEFNKKIAPSLKMNSVKTQISLALGE